MYSNPNLLKLQADLPRFTPAFIITGIYLLLGIIWIVWSDALVSQIAQRNPVLLSELQNKKGLFFVLLSSSLLFIISQTLYKRLRNAYKSKTTLEHKFEALNVAARGGMIDYDTQTKTAQINEKMNFFIPGTKQIVQNFFELFLERIHIADRTRVRSEYEMAIQSNLDVWTTEYQLLGSDGNYYTILSSLFLIREPQTNKIERLIGEIQDITQLRNLQAEYFNQQLKHKQRLATTIIKAQENERNRWAEELHDNVSQLLTVINLYLANTEVTKEKNISMINQAKQMVTEAQQEIRMLSASIKPPQFSLITLQQSIEKLIADISRVKQIQFKLIYHDFHESELRDEQMLMIYRIVQEQFNNIIKYAEATHIDITLQTKNDEVSILINDNGNGFDKNQLKTGLGFRNIQSRLQLFNGHMKIESVPGNGCSLSVSFPI